MAIEINEMVVRASTGPAVQASADPAPPAPDPAGENLEEIKKAVLAECRELIFEILAEREER